MSSEHKFTIEHNDFLRGCQVNVGLYRDMCWAILIEEVPGKDLFTLLNKNTSAFKGKWIMAFSTLLQKHSSDMSISKDDCDVALLYSIIRSLLTSLPPPTLGWDTEPLSTHISITDDVERMRLSRNHLYAHITRASLNETEFNTLMKEAEAIVERVGQHLCLIGSENSFKKYLGDIRYMDISDLWEIKIKELRDIEIENRKSIKDITERVEVLELAAAVNTYKDDESTEYAPGIVSQIQLEMEAFGASEENASKRRHLDRVCTILRKDKKDVVNVWPGYMQQQPQKPVFVVMTKDTSRGQWDTFLGIGIYRRQYDLVSDEAVAVLNSEKVQNNRLSRTEMDHVREVIDEEGDNLFDKHSNITVINGCSYKSKEGGSMLEPTPCVVIHCLVKGIIPFGEDLFPCSIGGIPTDVREGLFYLGLYDPDDNMDGVEVYGVPPDIPVQPGERSVDFNTTLRMGSGVGLLGCSGRGSIGGFVRFQNGDLGFITCAHVFASPFVDFNNINGRLVSQPADDDLPERQHSIRTICGTVNSCIFSGGVGVDAALVKISHDRLPTVAEFVWASPGHLHFAGFDVPPNFNNGRILTVSEINARRNQVVVKFGSSTSVTKGSIYLNGTMVRVSHPELLLQARNRSITFKRQIEICPIIGPSSTFFDLGDSGALVFMLSEGGNELQCIGMAIGFTKTNTCVVTPIEEVFKGLGFPAGQQFNRF